METAYLYAGPISSSVLGDRSRAGRSGRLFAIVPKTNISSFALFYLIAVFMVAWFGRYLPGAIACQQKFSERLSEY